ncbi:MAG TPA: hypothetical protein VGX24_04525 [Pyrinomonadaceae bacterium]|nr:hypothetical protein [Pyrinomonadaceae bacterium]
MRESRGSTQRIIITNHPASCADQPARIFNTRQIGFLLRPLPGR